MKVWARLFPEHNGDTVIAPSAIEGLVGQQVKSGDDTVTIEATRVSDGWVEALFEVPQGTELHVNLDWRMP